MKTDQPPETKEEGPRSFISFLGTIADGEAEAELSYQLHELTKRMQEEAVTRGEYVKGSLSLNIKMTVSNLGHAIIGYEVATKQPKRKTSGAAFWLTKGGNLTVDNPKQQKLVLREVKSPREAARDITEPNTAEAREV